MNSKTPWLKSDGTLKSEEEIKRSCKSWSPSVWEDYLKTLEVDQEEAVLDDPVLIEEHSQEADDNYYNSVLSVKEFPVLKKHLFDSIKELTFKQRGVLRLLFWDGLNLREVGQKMGVSTYAVARMRDRALKGLGLVMINRILSAMTKKGGEKSKTCYKFDLKKKEVKKIKKIFL